LEKVRERKRAVERLREIEKIKGKLERREKKGEIEGKGVRHRDRGRKSSGVIERNEGR